MARAWSVAVVLVVALACARGCYVETRAHPAYELPYTAEPPGDDADGGDGGR